MVTTLAGALLYNGRDQSIAAQYGDLSVFVSQGGEIAVFFRSASATNTERASVCVAGGGKEDRFFSPDVRAKRG